ncbi:MAG: hypothetical protein CMF62_03480 [Magnetococcales bacterium]|nr:hypothetical protein [Magnetococcales bacterium]|tara:strand:+ start:56 stop:472 length:417 start_codon:yes stop_codon:yes gene_type:complete
MDLNLNQRDYFLILIAVIVSLLISYMLGVNCNCKCITPENFVQTTRVMPTYARSLTKIPNVNYSVHNYMKEHGMKENSDMPDAGTCLFAGEKCGCCSGLECRDGRCQKPNEPLQPTTVNPAPEPVDLAHPMVGWGELM